MGSNNSNDTITGLEFTPGSVFNSSPLPAQAKLPVGEAGPAGPPGATGPAGPQGPAGPAGKDATAVDVPEYTFLDDVDNDEFHLLRQGATDPEPIAVSSVTAGATGLEIDEGTADNSAILHFVRNFKRLESSESSLVVEGQGSITIDHEDGRLIIGGTTSGGETPVYNPVVSSSPSSPSWDQAILSLDVQVANPALSSAEYVNHIVSVSITGTGEITPKGYLNASDVEVGAGAQSDDREDTFFRKLVMATGDSDSTALIKDLFGPQRTTPSQHIIASITFGTNEGSTLSQSINLGWGARNVVPRLTSIVLRFDAYQDGLTADASITGVNGFHNSTMQNWQLDSSNTTTTSPMNRIETNGAGAVAFPAIRVFYDTVVHPSIEVTWVRPAGVPEFPLDSDVEIYGRSPETVSQPLSVVTRYPAWTDKTSTPTWTTARLGTITQGGYTDLALGMSLIDAVPSTNINAWTADDGSHLQFPGRDYTFTNTTNVPEYAHFIVPSSGVLRDPGTFFAQYSLVGDEQIISIGQPGHQRDYMVYTLIVQANSTLTIRATSV